MGRIHSSGRVGARGLGVDIEWIVVGNGIADLSENELEIWYGAQDRFAVQIKPPGQPWTEPIEPGEFIENRQLPDLTLPVGLQRALPPGQRRQLHRRSTSARCCASRRSSACRPASGWSA